MKTVSVTILSIIFFCSFANAEIKEETYYKIGIFDYSHQTDMLAINKKKVTDNTFNSKYLGDLTQIYDLMFLGDVNESLIDDKFIYSIPISPALFPSSLWSNTPE